MFPVTVQASVLFSVDLYELFCTTSGFFKYRGDIYIKKKKTNRWLRGMNVNYNPLSN